MPPSQKPPHRALLLLPPAPEVPSYASFNAAYDPPLRAVLRELAGPSHRPQEPALLEIALPCPHLYGHLDAPRGPLYATTQQLLANLYKLVCIITSQEAIDTETAEGLDARVVLVAYPRDGRLRAGQPDSSAEQGPAVEIRALARNPIPWDAIYSVQSQEGEAVLKTFLSFSKAPSRVSRVQGGVVQAENSTHDITPREALNDTTSHFSVAVGGTFDHLHMGHKLLLTMFAFVLGRKQASSTNSNASILTVGITGDALLTNKKYAEHLESWKCRQECVHRFLSSVIYLGRFDDDHIDIREIKDAGPNGHAVHVSYPSGLTIRYVEIWDPFGPTITDKDMSALVLSLETRGGGAAVNNKRKEQGWDPLAVFEVAVLDASEEASVDEEFQSKLSSTEIRRHLCEHVQSKSKA